MTHDEMIAVIRALANYRQINMNWYTDVERTAERLQDFIGKPDLVVTASKPEPHYRPFKNVEEAMEAIKEHGYRVKNEANEARRCRILAFDDEKGVIFSCGLYTFDDAFNEFAFADGTPFGKLED